ncbi:MAG: hypothetical protein WCN81_14360 [Actinomycetes bacterium]
MTSIGDSGRAAGDRSRGLQRLTVLGVLTLLCVLIGGIGAGNARPSSGAATAWKTQVASSAVSSATLASVTSSDAMHAWAVGYRPVGAGLPPAPVILATSDGGATWNAQDASGAGMDAVLSSVTFSDAAHGWAAGAAGGTVRSGVPVILATTTGGQAGPKLTLNLSGLQRGALRLDQTLTTKGTVAPTRLAGSKLTLTVERRSGGAWRKVKSMTAQIAASGAYGRKYKPSKKGSYRIRTRVAETVANTAAATRWHAFKVR